MGPKAWIQWLLNEAVSNYIVLILAMIGGIIAWLMVKRKRPSLVRVTKEFEGQLVSIDDEVKDKLQVTYDGRPVTALYQAIFTINNTGDEPIKDIEITFYFEKGQDFLEATLTNAEGIWGVEISPLGPGLDSFTVGLPFLNPRRKYEDYLGVTLYGPKPLTVKAVTGKGLGWGTKYIDKAEYINRVARVIAERASPFGYFVAKAVDVLVRFHLSFCV